MNRTWTYGYTGQDLTSVTDPMTNKTTYTYGIGTGNTSPLLANDLLSITEPNAQTGGPDAGDSTVLAYNNAGQVTSQTDPMGWQTAFAYCVNATAGDCMNPPPAPDSSQSPTPTETKPSTTTTKAPSPPNQPGPRPPAASP